MYERAVRSIAGGVTSSNRMGAGKPLFFSHGAGGHLFDIDGNEYIDFKLGSGPLILGHSPQRVIEAVQAQMTKGMLFAGEHELAVQVAEHIQALVPCAELVHFANTGSEAVHYALRTARGYTGRSKVIKFEGHFHGGYDNVLASVSLPADRLGSRSNPVAAVESEGIPASAVQDLVCLPWNDLAALETYLDAHGDDVAAIIMTPIMITYGGNIFPLPGYLEGVRELCTRHAVVLIFDEVLCGFWSALGGAIELFGVEPDMVLYAKALGAGMPIACLAGRRQIMDVIANGRVKHQGTYNAHPVSMAAARASLDMLSDPDGDVYATMNRHRLRLTEALQDAADEHNIPLKIYGVGGLMQTGFLSEEAHDYRGASAIRKDLHRAFARALTERGVYSITYQWFISAAHTDEDIERTIEIATAALKTLQP